MQEFSSWYADEAARSYSASDDKNKYTQSMVNTYQAVTNRACELSLKGDEKTGGIC